MKTKLVSLIVALAGLNINVAANSANGSAGASFSSEYHRRGVIVSQDAVQAHLEGKTNVGGLDVSASFFTSQATEGAEVSSNELTLGAGGSLFEDKLNAYVGVYNTDFSNADAVLEGFISLSVNAPLNPTVTAYRGVSNNLNTFEGQISHSFDLSFAELGLKGALGNTETSATTDSTYSSVTASLSKDISENLKVYADFSASDNDSRDYETFWGAGVSVSF